MMKKNKALKFILGLIPFATVGGTAAIILRESDYYPPETGESLYDSQDFEYSGTFTASPISYEPRESQIVTGGIVSSEDDDDDDDDLNIQNDDPQGASQDVKTLLSEKMKSEKMTEIYEGFYNLIITSKELGEQFLNSLDKPTLTAFFKNQHKDWSVEFIEAFVEGFLKYCATKKAGK